MNTRALDQQYVPFPSLRDWLDQCSLPEEWDALGYRVAQIRQSASETQLLEAARVALRAAAVETGAIENLYETDASFTMSVAMQSAAWQTDVTVKGQAAKEHITSQLETYERVLDLVTKDLPMVETFIRQLHEQVCKGQETYAVQTGVGEQQQPLPKGRYKSVPNHVRTRRGDYHAYASVESTPPEMQRLGEELDSDLFRNTASVIQAAYAHYALVAVHPFADGNGRVARALASFYSMRHLSVPVMIWSDRREAYYQALEAADNGEYQVFVEFISDRVKDAIGLIDLALKSTKSGGSEALLNEIQNEYRTASGLRQIEIGKVALSVLNLLQTEIAEQISGLPKIDELSISSTQTDFNTHSPITEHRQSQSQASVRIRMVSAYPKVIESSKSLSAHIPIECSDHSTLKVFQDQDDQPLLELRITEAHPELSINQRLQIRLIAQTVLTDMLDHHKHQVRQIR